MMWKCEDQPFTFSLNCNELLIRWRWFGGRNDFTATWERRECFLRRRVKAEELRAVLFELAILVEKYADPTLTPLQTMWQAQNAVGDVEILQEMLIPWEPEWSTTVEAISSAVETVGLIAAAKRALIEQEHLWKTFRQDFCEMSS